MEANREYYENLFVGYASVVDLEGFKKMLGGIGDVQARRLLREKHCRSFKKGHGYMIPKVFVIDYVLSDHYKEYRKHLIAKV